MQYLVSIVFKLDFKNNLYC